LLFIRLQRVQRFLHELSSQLLFFSGRQFGVAGDVDDAGAEDDAVGTDHFGDRFGSGDLHHRDAGLLQFSCNRSAAASAGSSRRRKNHRVDPALLRLGRHLAAHAPGIR